ncbi:hypothetical protein ACLKA7_008673 [Drosophila subpalustris]
MATMCTASWCPAVDVDVTMSGLVCVFVIVNIGVEHGDGDGDGNLQLPGLSRRRLGARKCVAIGATFGHKMQRALRDRSLFQDMGAGKRQAANSRPQPRPSRKPRQRQRPSPTIQDRPKTIQSHPRQETSQIVRAPFERWICNLTDDRD